MSAPLPLRIRERSNANAPDYLVSGGQAFTGFLGKVSYFLPWDVGTVSSGGCTKLAVNRSENSGGALDLSIRASQIPGCLQPYSIYYKLVPFTNPNSIVQIGARGTVTYITGTEGGVTERDGVVYSGVSNGTVLVTAEKGEAVITEGRMGVARDGRVTVDILPYPWLKFSPQGEAYSHPSNTISRNGKVYTVTNVAGQSKRYWVWRSPNYFIQIEPLKD